MAKFYGNKGWRIKNGWNKNLTRFTVCLIILRKGYQFSDDNRE
jgi:hypothetical protein